MANTTLSYIDFFKQVEQMREAGYAVAIFTPDEVGTYGAKDLENLMVRQASEALDSQKLFENVMATERS